MTAPSPWRARGRFALLAEVSWGYLNTRCECPSVQAAIPDRDHKRWIINGQRTRQVHRVGPAQCVFPRDVTRELLDGRG